jgi:broad specificity phosphatase PhoE
MSGPPTQRNPSGTGTNPTAKRRKSLYLIRHAESEENRRLASLQNVVRCILGLSWPETSVVKAALELMDVSGQVDSPVSPRGKLQISDVRSQLRHGNFLESNGVELILHSPLQRAWETCVGLFPPESIAGGQLLSSTSSTAGSACKMEETDLLLEKTPTEWIFTSSFHERIRQFAEFVEQRPESTVVAVGHSQFFRAMLGVNFKFNNCDVWHVELSSSTSTPLLPPSPSAPLCPSAEAAGACTPQTVDGEEDSIATQPPWSNLRQVFVCSPSETEPNEKETNGADSASPVDDGDKPSSAKDKNA